MATSIAMNANLPTPRGSSSSSSNPVPSVSYEVFAPRSSVQVQRWQRIAQLTAGPIPTSTEISSPSINGSMIHQLEGASRSNANHEVDLTVAHTTRHLTQAWKHATAVKLALHASTQLAQDLSQRHAALMKHSGELSAAADRLQQEEELLSQHAAEIGRPLEHYNAVDEIAKLLGVWFQQQASQQKNNNSRQQAKSKTTTVRGLAQLKVDADEYPETLERIDQAIQYFSSSSSTPAQQSSGNAEYLRRAQLLQESALALVQEAVADRITATAQQILASSKTKIFPADQLEASAVFTRFHGISARSQMILQRLQERIAEHNQTKKTNNNTSNHRMAAPYVDMLQTCRNTYCTQRQTLLWNTLRAHMDQLQKQHGTVAMTRLASVFLIRFCTIETALYWDFFRPTSLGNANNDSSISNKDTTAATAPPRDNQEAVRQDETFQNYLTTLCSSLHRTIRRSLVKQADLDTLCQIVSVLREERTMASASPTTLAAARAITAVIQDAQERLIYCANTALEKQVIRFKATPSDLNYPEKLRKTNKPEAATASDASEQQLEQQLEQVYESWFPPVRSVLQILSKIFRVVEPAVFEDLAFSSVQACNKCLRSAATYIGSRATAGVLHSDLFLVQHLLILREQLSPFDVELRAVERQLDFSSAGKAMRVFLAQRNRRLLFRMNDENALLQLLRDGVSVQESSLDSKHDLEEALRAACNDFISHTSARVTPHLLDWDGTDRAPLDRFFATVTPDYAREQMTAVTTQMALYLENPGTQSILLKPVSRKITKALEEVRPAVEGDAEKMARLTALEETIKRTARASRGK